MAKQIVDHREDQERGKIAAPKPKLTLDEFYAQAGEEGPKELTVVLKADVQGTCEAARDSLEKLTTDEVTLRVLSSGVGAITRERREPRFGERHDRARLQRSSRSGCAAPSRHGRRRDPYLLDHHGDAR